MRERDFVHRRNFLYCELGPVEGYESLVCEKPISGSSIPELMTQASGLLQRGVFSIPTLFGSLVSAQKEELSFFPLMGFSKEELEALYTLNASLLLPLASEQLELALQESMTWPQAVSDQPLAQNFAESNNLAKLQEASAHYRAYLINTVLFALSELCQQSLMELDSQDLGGLEGEADEESADPWPWQIQLGLQDLQRRLEDLDFSNEETLFLETEELLAFTDEAQDLNRAYLVWQLKKQSLSKYREQFAKLAVVEDPFYQSTQAKLQVLESCLEDLDSPWISAEAFEDLQTLEHQLRASLNFEELSATLNYDFEEVRINSDIPLSAVTLRLLDACQLKLDIIRQGESLFQEDFEALESDLDRFIAYYESESKINYYQKALKKADQTDRAYFNFDSIAVLASPLADLLFVTNKQKNKVLWKDNLFFNPEIPSSHGLYESMLAGYVEVHAQLQAGELEEAQKHLALLHAQEVSLDIESHLRVRQFALVAEKIGKHALLFNAGMGILREGIVRGGSALELGKESIATLINLANRGAPFALSGLQIALDDKNYSWQQVAILMIANYLNLKILTGSNALGSFSNFLRSVAGIHGVSSGQKFFEKISRGQIDPLQTWQETTSPESFGASILYTAAFSVNTAELLDAWALMSLSLSKPRQGSPKVKGQIRVSFEDTKPYEKKNHAANDAPIRSEPMQMAVGHDRVLDPIGKTEHQVAGTSPARLRLLPELYATEKSEGDSQGSSATGSGATPAVGRAGGGGQSPTKPSSFWEAFQAQLSRIRSGETKENVAAFKRLFELAKKIKDPSELLRAVKIFQEVIEHRRQNYAAPGKRMHVLDHFVWKKWQELVGSLSSTQRSEVVFGMAQAIAYKPNPKTRAYEFKYILEIFQLLSDSQKMHVIELMPKILQDAPERLMDPHGLDYLNTFTNLLVKEGNAELRVNFLNKLEFLVRDTLGEVPMGTLSRVIQQYLRVHPKPSQKELIALASLGVTLFGYNAIVKNPNTLVKSINEDIYGLSTPATREQIRQLLVEAYFVIRPELRLQMLTRFSD
ncbi:MAG: hypothetical protein KDK66_01485 [Deltaproteobacteria bacterium]|nr:hypothetical protein [Deltaproteobacteria bacterium]